MRFERQATLAAALAICVGGGAAEAQDLTEVRYQEVIRSIFYLPSYVAIEAGYFEDEGLEVELSTSWGSDKGMAALLSGTADVVLVGPEAAVYVARGESPEKVKIFSGLTASDGSMIVARTAPDGTFDWSSLEGETILSWRVGSMPALFLEHILRENGIDPQSDVEILTNIAAPARYGAFMAGTAEFGTFFEPDVSRMERDGTGVMLASVGQAVGDIDYTVFVATDSFIEENPDVVQGWTDAIHRAQKHVAEGDPMEIAELVTGYFPEVDLELIADSVTRYRDLDMWKSTPIVEPEAIAALQDLMVEGRLLGDGERIPYEDLVATGFAETAVETAER